MNRFILCVCTFAAAITVGAQTSSPVASVPAAIVPENLGLGLRQLVEIFQRDQVELQKRLSATPSIMADTSGRVVVNIQFNGEEPFPEVEAKLAALGVEIIAADRHWRGGVISGWLPLWQAVAAANLPGVRSVARAPRPVRRVGVVTAESSVVEHAAEVNTPGAVTPQGILGRGISIGLISDSYDTAAGVPRATAGIASGDLPGPGNPNGYSAPVIVLKDETSSDVADEGRGMAEIVHDIAPAAKISFSTAGATQVAMAASIRNLRTHSQTLCDVIVDDIGFADEPFFSDGIISQAIDDVSTSDSLPGKKVAYFSAAGNSGGRGYSADANIISSSAGQQNPGNLRLNQVPSSLYAGGFHNFSTNGTPVIAMRITTATETGQLVFQWDDPFNSGGVTTNYNLLVFSETGSYLATISGTDNNFATSQPIELVDLSPNTTYQLAISLASGAPPIARHLRMISFGGTPISGNYLADDIISLFGHPSAANANAVAAYVYNNGPEVVSNYNPGMSNPPPGPYEPALESFNSRGGSLPFYFNAQGQRLFSPEIRLKPEFAAADGVDTSFFPADAGADYDNNGYPNFFGTSAAAPNAAAFAALLLEAAGGPGSLSPGQVRAILQQSTYPHDLDPNSSRGTIAGIGSRTVDLIAAGDDSNESATSPAFFTLTFSGQNGDTLNQLIVDLSNTSIIFDPRADLGFPFTVGQNDGSVSITSSLSPDSRTLTLTFGDTFTSGKAISFGLDRDLAAINAGGNSADLLGGVSIAATINSGPMLYGALGNQLGDGFIPTDGHGLIDAKIAVEAIVGKQLASTGAAANLSTRGIVGTGENVLIGGLIIEGTAAKVILRAIGPTLPVPGALPDPALELHNANGLQIAADDNWQDDNVQAAQIQATGIPPNDPRESALVESLSPGNYTAIVRGSNNTTGIGLVEAYDLDSQPAVSRMANIATRGTVQTGDNVMIAGFILRNGPSSIVVRAVGPSLFTAGVSGALADPALELRDSQGNLLASVDNWQEHTFQAIQLTAIGLAPAAAVESALTTTLNPGGYTAIVRGAHDTTGVALVEVYTLR